MIFQEKKVEDGYEYKIEDVFGVIDIKSDQQLEADTLDGMVLLLMRQDKGAGQIRGSVQHETGSVDYTFTRAPQWEEDDEEDDPELCENTRISIHGQESAFTQINRWTLRILKKLRKSVEVLREVWRK